MRDDVTITMATTPERVENAAVAVRALAPQCGSLCVYVNGSGPVGVLEDAGATVVAYGSDGDLADLGKWWFAILTPYHLACDDDLVYPPDYVARTVEEIDRHDGKAIISWHGARIKKRPMTNFYRDRLRFPVLGTVAEDTRVHFPGAGVMGMHMQLIPSGWPKPKVPYMGDILWGIAALENGVPVIVPAHVRGWIEHQEIDHSLEIYNRFRDCCEVQTWLVNRHKWPHL